MDNLGSWMNDVLSGWGVSPTLANVLDEMVIALLLIGVAICVNYVCQGLLVRILHRLRRSLARTWEEMLMRRRVLHHFIHIIPGVMVYELLPLAFIRNTQALGISQKLCVVYIIISLLLTLNGFLLMMLDIYNASESGKSRPMRGFVQVLQVLVFFVGSIVVVGVLIGKSPLTLFAGLGASAAVLMLIFKDSILGFVSGVQLTANDMVRIGDWIQLPNGSANGIVQEITLNTVKIQNWDNTISTVPPYTLVNGSFQNWRGMQEGGGRRVCKNIYLDMNTLHFCSSDVVDTICHTIPLMSDYQPAEGEIPTNAQLYRIYIERYLCSLPVVNQEMDLIITQKQPTEFGVPIQVYFFSRVKIWKEYERIQSDIFDHLLVMVQPFGLKLYQYN